MAKVLISFLGVAADGYKPANYQFNDKTVISSTFIAKALKEYHQIDKLILIGTAHSMWDEVYKALGKDGTNYNIEKYKHLKQICTASNHDTILKENEIKSIEDGFGINTKVIIIKYGLNDEEIAYNTKKVFSLETFLEKDDILYLDITHSFRSLPIYLMNCLVYLKNVCNKNLSIESISYGMLDVSREFPTGNKVKVGEKEVDELWTPVVELKKILDIQDWIIGAYNFKEFGNTYKIASLLEKDKSGNYDKVAMDIKEFADIKNLNYLNTYMSATAKLQELATGSFLPEIGKMVIVPTMKDFISLFPQNLRLSKFQIRMAKWHNERHNYGFALIMLVESIVSFCCEILRYDPYDRTKREDAKRIIKDKFYSIDKRERKKIKHFNFHDKEDYINLFCTEYESIKDIRNIIVHNNSNLKLSSIQLVESIGKEIEYFEGYIDKKRNVIKRHQLLK